MLAFVMRYITHSYYVNSFSVWPIDAYVLVISRLGGMLRVYRPEGRGSINRHIQTRRDITNL